jgi:hypothetical protein
MQNIPHDEVSARAHAIWEKAGCPEGQETEHWLQAERELHQESTQSGKFEAVPHGDRSATAGTSGRKVQNR